MGNHGNESDDLAGIAEDTEGGQGDATDSWAAVRLPRMSCEADHLVIGAAVHRAAGVGVGTESARLGDGGVERTARVAPVSQGIRYR